MRNERDSTAMVRNVMRGGRNAVPVIPALRRFGALVLLATLAALAPCVHAATLDDLVSSVVRIKTIADPDGQTAQSLGREREGSGIVIDENGLVLTIGYVMVEAHAAEIVTNDGRVVPANIVGYDQETGFGLLQAISPLKVKSLPLGKSSAVQEKDPVVVATFGGLDNAGAA